MTTVNEFFDMRTAPMRIGTVRLKVRNLDRMASFYELVLGLTPIETTGGRITLGNGASPLLELMGDSALGIERSDERCELGQTWHDRRVQSLEDHYRQRFTSR